MCYCRMAQRSESPFEKELALESIGPYMPLARFISDVTSLDPYMVSPDGPYNLAQGKTKPYHQSNL